MSSHKAGKKKHRYNDESVRNVLERAYRRLKGQNRGL